MEHWAEYLARTIYRNLDFLQLWSIPSKSITELEFTWSYFVEMLIFEFDFYSI